MSARRSVVPSRGSVVSSGARRSLPRRPADPASRRARRRRVVSSRVFGARPSEQPAVPPRLPSALRHPCASKLVVPATLLAARLDEPAQPPVALVARPAMPPVAPASALAAQCVRPAAASRAQLVALVARPARLPATPVAVSAPRPARPPSPPGVPSAVVQSVSRARSSVAVGPPAAWASASRARSAASPRLLAVSACALPSDAVSSVERLPSAV
mmetsp:Transcript_11655/g.24811  ORF Transcript_11655/g.24811 Transcript_11655/m.24811 type:complete len:215 (+) Transcript_11655:3482-4126(+)